MRTSTSPPLVTTAAKVLVLRALAIILGVAVTLRALAPLRELVRDWNDFAFVFAAGRVWLKGGSPYDVPLWQEQWSAVYPSFAGLVPTATHAPTQPYLYPPHWAIVAIPLALLPWPWACRIWDVTNVLSYGIILAMLLRMLSARAKVSWLSPGVWLCLAVASANGAVRWTFWECQLSMVPLLGVVGAFAAWAHGRKNWVIVFTFVALLKPQIGVLPLFYLGLIGAFSSVALGGLLALGVGALALLHVDWSLLPAQLHECVRLHLAIKYNGFEYFYSVSSLLARFGALSFLSQVFGFAMIASLAWWQYRAKKRGLLSKPSAAAQLALACACCVAFVPLHGYDLVLLTPLVFWAYTLQPRWVAVTLCVLVVMAARLLAWGESAGVHPLAPWATLAIFVLTATAWFRELHAPDTEVSPPAAEGSLAHL